jgi:zinc transporter 5/7
MLGRGMKSSSSGLPLYGFESVDTSDKYFKPSRSVLFGSRSSVWGYIEHHVRQIAASKETRKVFYFLLLNVSFTGVEFLYGYITNSLGLTADAVHMLFDSSAIILSLAAGVIAKWDATESYTLGFSRVETLAGFVNALALFFASGNIVWEALERLWNPQELASDKLLLVSFLGFLVNLGVFSMFLWGLS